MRADVAAGLSSSVVRGGPIVFVQPFGWWAVDGWQIGVLLWRIEQVVSGTGAIPVRGTAGQAG
jgi:hypothetical protein